MRRFVALDVDGVLNAEAGEARFFPDRDKLLWNHHPATTPEQVDLANTDALRKNVRLWELDPIKVGMLAEVVNSCAASVILTSSWRYLFSHQEMDVLLNWVNPVWKLGSMAGATDKKGPTRANELMRWLDENAPDYTDSTKTRLVVLDDSDDGMTELFPDCFVQTDPRVGLTFLDVKERVIPKLDLKKAGKFI